MKKIFLILLCSALIFSAVCGLGISASAEESVNLNNLQGVWVFNDTLNLPTSQLTYTDKWEYMNGRNINWDADPYLAVNSSGFYFKNVNGELAMYDGSNSSWNSYFGNSIYFAKSDTSSSFFKWVKANATKVADAKPTHCNGSMCSTTPDENGDNICDDCGLPFVWSLRNDTYDFNGYSFALYFEDTNMDGVSQTLLNYYKDDITVNNGDFILLAQSDNFDGAALYAFSKPIVVDSSGKLSIASDNTIVSLFVAGYTDDGSPFWRLNGRETWNTGAHIATLSQVHWSADDLTNSSGTVVFNGDENFMIPLWEKLDLVTQVQAPGLQNQILGTLKNLTASSVGLLACGILLFLLVKVLSKSRNI